jgi:hypothetical protein
VCVPRPDVLFLVNQSFNVARQLRLVERRFHVCRCARASAVPCIPRAKLPPVRVRSVSVLRYRLQAPLVLAAGPVPLRGVPASVTFRAE